MKFVRKTINPEKYIDNIFVVTNMAKADPEGINATAGCLFGEDGKLLAYKSVFDNEKEIANSLKAAYSTPEGNKEYLELITKHILEDRVKTPHKTVATAGGTGALYLGTKTCLGDGDTIIFPEIAWGNYKVIAQELNLNVINYDVYNIDSLFNAIDKANDKVFVVINSPCHNPCGQEYSFEEWKKIIDKLNNCNKDVVLLNDIAYIDYANENAKQYFDLFNSLNDNVLVLLAFSCSKSFSYYGKRLGALIAINNDTEFIDYYINLCTRLCRATWSNCNNEAMLNIVSLLKNKYDEYTKERNDSLIMLRKRVDLFIKQAQENNLEFYPYTAGFFVTLKVDDLALRDKIHKALLDNRIYTIKVNKGIRIGLCSVPINRVDGLATRIANIIKEVS